MVTFNELRIDNDNDLIIIDGYIDTSIYPDGKFTRVQLVSYDNISADGLIVDNNKVYTVFERTTENYSSHRWEVTLNACKSTLDISTFDLGLFYVIVNSSYTDAPSSTATVTEYAVIVDWEAVYKMGMPYVAALASKGFNVCDLPVAFEEFVMLWYGLQLAISVCDYTQIATMWRRFLRIYGDGASVGSQCGCGN